MFQRVICMHFNHKKIRGIAYPILISLLIEHLINITDTAFPGHVGETVLGASAIAGLYYMAIYMLGFGFSIGVQILIARRNGERNYAVIGNIFHTGATGLLVLAVFMFFLSGFLTPYIFHRLISSENVYNAALSYLNWRIYGFFFSFPAILFRTFYNGIEQHCI